MGSNEMTLVEAVEAITGIVEVPWENDLEEFYDVLEEGEVINWKDPHWILNENDPKVQQIVKNIFKVILDHLKSIEEGSYQTDEKSLERIKTIMVLVGEAAKKIDRFTHLFKKQKSVTSLREYLQLQEFYKKRISRTIDEALLGKWILALSQRTFSEKRKKYETGIRSLETKHLFVDMESVKKDSDYELFFIRKEDGTRFFSPRLIRNIKLVCDFGALIGSEKEKDPLIDFKIWEDRFYQSYAVHIKEALMPEVKDAFAQIFHHREEELARLTLSAINALMLASQDARLLDKGSPKGCKEYFKDFQAYLRSVLHHRVFQHILAMLDQEEENPLYKSILKVVNASLAAIFKQGGENQTLNALLRYLLSEDQEVLSNKKHPMIWHRLANDYSSLQKTLKKHPNGPLNKVLEILEEGDFDFFEPYGHGVLPETLFKVRNLENHYSIHALATPTLQENINHANVIDEFQQFLRDQLGKGKPILLLNFQDETSWKEHARTEALERMMSMHAADYLTLVTLPKETEFYYQEMPYETDHQYAIFKKHLIEHVFDRATGFNVPEKVCHEINEAWSEKLCDTIHQIFFSGRNVLTKEARMDFIEIFYLFFELKLIEVTKAEEVFMICKDGFDISSTAGMSLYVFLKLLQKKHLSNEEYEQIIDRLFKGALLNRQRILHPERFYRLISVLKLMESVKEELGEQFAQKIRKVFSFCFNHKTLALSESLIT